MAFAWHTMVNRVWGSPPLPLAAGYEPVWHMLMRHAPAFLGLQKGDTAKNGLTGGKGEAGGGDGVGVFCPEPAHKTPGTCKSQGHTSTPGTCKSQVKDTQTRWRERDSCCELAEIF